MSEPMPDEPMTNFEREQYLQATQQKAADAAKQKRSKIRTFRAILRDGRKLLRMSEKEFADELRVGHTKSQSVDSR